MIRSGRTGCGKQGVVSAGRAEAAQIGRDILARGGNAIDAAVAVAFAMGVCEPNASGIGGGGFMLIRDGKTGKSVFLDFRENAPMAATPAMYTPKAPGSNYDKDLSNVYGGKAVGVPGDVAGLLYALEQYGTMTPEQVISPAAQLAREGYDPKYGARPLRRVIQRTVEDTLSEELLLGHIALGDTVRLHVVDGRIAVDKVPEAHGAPFP